MKGLPERDIIIPMAVPATAPPPFWGADLTAAPSGSMILVEVAVLHPTAMGLTASIIIRQSDPKGCRRSPTADIRIRPLIF